MNRKSRRQNSIVAKVCENDGCENTCAGFTSQVKRCPECAKKAKIKQRREYYQRKKQASLDGDSIK
ncbi:hypothetical protein LCGC14_2402860 [marine sediment metagenome]|uniref:Phage protein n=1 Tax=marine sediment metagenome TaxID=412755 RepID=A0A0F9CGV5_9ZZZZ